MQFLSYLRLSVFICGQFCFSEKKYGPQINADKRRSKSLFFQFPPPSRFSINARVDRPIAQHAGAFAPKSCRRSESRSGRRDSASGVPARSVRAAVRWSCSIPPPVRVASASLHSARSVWRRSDRPPGTIASVTAWARSRLRANICVPGRQALSGLHHRRRNRKPDGRIGHFRVPAVGSICHASAATSSSLTAMRHQVRLHREE